MRLTPARRHALDILAHTDRHHGTTRISNTTTPDPPAIYWQTAGWLEQAGLAAITGQWIAITAAGRDLHYRLLETESSEGEGQ